MSYFLDYNLVRTRLTELMEEHGDSYRALARKIGVSNSTVARWILKDTGSINNKALINIANVYNVNVAWILGVPGETKEKEDESHRAKRDEIYERMGTLSNKQLDMIVLFIETFVEKK